MDCGCGTGENALYLASRGHEVWGIDASPNAIRKAESKAKDRGIAVKFLTTDALDLTLTPWERPFCWTPASTTVRMHHS
ncbi:MAG: class I SAM-dependent methyltransferase, partial [Spirochaetia bacterium]